mgnify:CR=1 FL=1
MLHITLLTLSLGTHSNLYLVGNTLTINALKRAAEGGERVRFRDPVNFNNIIQMLNNYDVGFFYVEPTTFNLLNCLPNKFFEFIQARLAIAIGPSPDMSAIVRQYDCGIVSENFSVGSMAAALNALTVDEIDLFKTKSDRAARDLNFDVESEVLLKALHELH